MRRSRPMSTVQSSVANTEVPPHLPGASRAWSDNLLIVAQQGSSLLLNWPQSASYASGGGSVDVEPFATPTFSLPLALHDMASIRRWWTSDTALHTYIYAQTLISLPFSVFGTYTQYQLQAVGYAIGKDSVGGPCVDYCIVPWLGTHMDLNSVLLYMNAFGIGLSGLITLFLAAYSDYWCESLSLRVEPV